MSFASLVDQSFPSSSLIQKRRRSPSQYADLICELKKEYSKTSKKLKTSQESCNDPVLGCIDQQKGNRNCLNCNLPSGRRLQLTIEIKSNTSSRSKRKAEEGNRSDKENYSSGNAKVVAAPSTDLLSKFLLAAEELNRLEQTQKEQKHKKDDNEPVSASSLQQKQLALRQERQSNKYIRFYEKSRCLNDQLDHLSDCFFQI